MRWLGMCASSRQCGCDAVASCASRRLPRRGTPRPFSDRPRESAAPRHYGSQSAGQRHKAPRQRLLQGWLSLHWHQRSTSESDLPFIADNTHASPSNVVSFCHQALHAAAAPGPTQPRRRALCGRHSWRPYLLQTPRFDEQMTAPGDGCGMEIDSDGWSFLQQAVFLAGLVRPLSVHTFAFSSVHMAVVARALAARRRSDILVIAPHQLPSVASCRPR
jgi:hypothetical protein